MPTSATFNIDDEIDLVGMKPTVDLENEAGNLVTQPADTCSCLMINYIAGPVPGKAILKAYAAKDLVGPVTLNRYEVKRPYGARVKIYIPATTEENANGVGDRSLFLGTIMGRHDAGQKDEVQWIAHDDREILSNLFVRGCLVADTDSKPVMNRRYTARFNPGGMWNCTGVALTGLSQMVQGAKQSISRPVAPVFTPYGSMGRAYETPVQGYDLQELAVGKVIPWTARLALMYLCNLAYIPGDIADVIPGIASDTWRSLSLSQKLLWDYSSIIGMNGRDPANPSLPDVLDRKLPDLTIRGESFNGAIQKILDACGTHAWWVGPQERSQTADANMSAVQFFPIGANGSNAGRKLWLQRGGVIGSANTVYDFDVSEDASNVKPAVLVDGAPVRAETSLDYDFGDDTLGLNAAWKPTEEDNFSRVVMGSDLDEANPGIYAKVPPIVGDITTPFAQWEDADGKQRANGSYRPFAWAKTKEAISLARQYYPMVYIAFKINPTSTQVTTALDGVSGYFGDHNVYPQMKHNRPILPKQLGYMLFDLLGDEKPANYMLNHFPIRLQIQSSEDVIPIDAVPTPNITMTGDGIIWIRGMAEELDGDQMTADSWRCLYEGSFYGPNILKIRMKKLKLNVVFPMDHRCGKFVQDNGEQVLRQKYCDDLGGVPILYIDNPDDSFQEGHQINSSPTASQAMSTGATNISQPLTRYAPPGSERVYAEAHARRRLMYSRKPERKSAWRLPWIRTEYPLGTWLSYIAVLLADEANGADFNYEVNAAIMQVTFDFQAQETTLSGVVGSL